MELGSHEREELAWAAGFFDGEGCTSVHSTKVNHVAARLTISQAGEEGIPEVLLRFQAAVHPAKVYITGPRTDGRERKPQYRLGTASFENVQAILCQLWPWLGAIKRDQAVRAVCLVRENRRKRDQP